MALTSKSSSQITRSIIRKLSANSSFSAFKEGQKLRALIDALSEEIGIAYRTFDINLAKGLISGATGEYLDLIGELLGERRLEATSIALPSTSQAIRFYTSSGATFGSINGGFDIIIPEGTVISAEESRDRPIRYTITAETTLDTADTVAYVPVESLDQGALATVGENTLIKHDFTDYADAGNESLKVTNTIPIADTRDRESDNDFKVRLRNKTRTVEAANRTAIRYAALSVPGVASVYLREFPHGVGSGEVIVQATTARTSTLVLDAVQTAINEVKGHGLLIMAIGPHEIEVEVSMRLTLAKGTLENDKTRIQKEVRTAIIQFIDRLPLGAGFTSQQLLNIVLNVDPAIRQVGSVGRPFDELYVYKQSLVDSEATISSRGRRSQVRNIELKPHEKLVVSKSPTQVTALDPINVEINKVPLNLTASPIPALAIS